MSSCMEVIFMSQPQLVLASVPRRLICWQIGIGLICSAADLDETPKKGELPASYARRLAIAKARLWPRMMG